MERAEDEVRMVVGLGNPGRKYERTRHNIGFLVLDRLLGSAGEGVFRPDGRWKALVAKRPGDAVVYLKPQTFMNLSGEAVAPAMRYYKLEPGSVLVVYDDVDLPFGQLRFRARGSAGGHNGIKSLIGHLGTERFPRLKIGVGGGEEDVRKSLADHVLGKFSEDESRELENCLDRAEDAVRYALSCGVGAAMNRFNQKVVRPTGRGGQEGGGDGGGESGDERITPKEIK